MEGFLITFNNITTHQPEKERRITYPKDDLERQQNKDTKMNNYNSKFFICSLILIVISSISFSTLHAQISFEQVVPPEQILIQFDGVSRGSIAFADVDNDNDQDVLITGYNASSNQGIANYTRMTEVAISLK